MKRMWIGILLLAAALAVGIWSAGKMEGTHLEISRQLRQAEELAAEGDWDGALSFAARAEGRWRAERPATAALIAHEHMDDVEKEFAQLRIYAGAGDRLSFCVTCAELASRLEALGESHSFTLGNLL